jgi:hypothetical protein
MEDETKKVTKWYKDIGDWWSEEKTCYVPEYNWSRTISKYKKVVRRARLLN